MILLPIVIAMIVMSLKFHFVDDAQFEFFAGHKKKNLERK